MPLDDVERLIRDAVAREVEAGRPGLVGLEKRVMAQLALPHRPGFGERIRSLVTARPLRWGWAVAGAAALVVLGFMLGRLSSEPPKVAALPAAAPNLFALAAPGARSVALMGDFSAWQPIQLSDPDGDGVWVVSLALPPGRYQYAFLVDGKWVGQDPLASEYVRAFGEYVSVRYVLGENP